VQVDPIKPTLRAPVTKRLKLNCVEPLLNFAFNLNLRHYNEALAADLAASGVPCAVTAVTDQRYSPADHSCHVIHLEC